MIRRFATGLLIFVLLLLSVSCALPAVTEDTGSTGAAPLIDEPFNHGELGVLMPKGNEALLEYVNEFIEKEKSSGRLDELAKEYIYLSGHLNVIVNSLNRQVC